MNALKPIVGQWYRGSTNELFEVVAIDDADGLATAINRCLNDPALCQRLVEGGRHAYESQFTRDVLVRDLLAFYRKARDSGSSGHEACRHESA